MPSAGQGVAGSAGRATARSDSTTTMTSELAQGGQHDAVGQAVAADVDDRHGDQHGGQQQVARR